MQILLYDPTYAEQIASLFHAAVHAIDDIVYSPAQKEAWSSDDRDMSVWRDRLEKKQPFLAIEEDTVIGFIELEADGHIDCMYVHPEHQRKGVGQALYEHIYTVAMERGYSRLYVEASDIAKPFFLKQGFETIRTQTVEKNGETLANTCMELMMKPSKPTLIFDWGSVLAPDDCIIAADHLSVAYDCDHDTLKEMLEDEDGFSTSADFDGYTSRITKTFSIPREEIIIWKNKSLPNSTFDYCKELRAEGYDLYLLSDQMQFRTDHIKKSYDLSCFADTFFSSDIGYTKASKKAFLHVIEQTGIDPRNTIFVDDSADNVRVAESVGLTGIVYTDLESLKEELETNFNARCYE